MGCAAPRIPVGAELAQTVFEPPGEEFLTRFTEAQGGSQKIRIRIRIKIRNRSGLCRGKRISVDAPVGRVGSDPFLI